MADWDDVRWLVGEQVKATHWTGMQFSGVLVGIADQPTAIIDTPDGDRVVFTLSSLDAVKAA